MLPVICVATCVMNHKCTFSISTAIVLWSLPMVDSIYKAEKLSVSLHCLDVRRLSHKPMYVLKRFKC